MNTATLPVLKSAETRELLRRCREGDRMAREELISGNLRLVLSVVQRFAGRGESMDDLFQVGCIRSDDRGRAAALSAGPQRAAGIPVDARHGL